MRWGMTAPNSGSPPSRFEGRARRSTSSQAASYPVRVALDSPLTAGRLGPCARSLVATSRPEFAVSAASASGREDAVCLLEHERLEGHVRLDRVVAHEGDHLAPSDLLDCGDDVVAHGLLELAPQLEHELLLGAHGELALGGGHGVLEEHVNGVLVQEGPRLGGSTTGVVGKDADDRPGDLCRQRSVGAGLVGARHRSLLFSPPPEVPTEGGGAKKAPATVSASHTLLALSVLVTGPRLVPVARGDTCSDGRSTRADVLTAAWLPQ